MATTSLVCLDTSALSKRYIQEPGSDRVRAMARDATISLCIGQLVRTELASGLARRVRERDLTAVQAAAAMALYLDHEVNEYQVIALTVQIQQEAEAVLFRRPLRAADALHVATARSVQASLDQPVRFVTADRRQAEAARAEGLHVELVGQ